ncbi:hypothetical protein AGDE_12086 [Angomonas deanei]|nr:hypothetical protein AGDE_12086 [Angomonas deanei]|eukprot:EPY24959.1 hypothetical protein AGDE_12086 [Angomonas deanei]
MSSFPLLFLYLVQDRLEFSGVMLTCTAKILRRHKGLFILALFMVLLTVGFCILAIYLILPPILRGLADEQNQFDTSYIIFVIFGVFWVQEVMRNVMHVTSCGVVATWYFAGEARLPPSPIKSSFTRAVTTSIGSICFGSLLVAVVRFLRFLVETSRSAADDNNFLSCIFDCILHCVESLVSYFNEYAFVHVAVYGCGYVDAAKKTIALVRQCFFAGIFNDCLAGMATDILTLMIATCVGVAAGILTWSVSFGVVMFVVSLFINATAFQVVQSAVTTIFVCFAELPEGLAVSFPSLYTLLITTDRGYTHHTDGYGAV